MNITEHAAEQVNFRVVVTAEDEQGRSAIAEDRRAATVVVTPLFSSVDVWQTASVPAAVTAADGLDPKAPSIEPPHGGLVVRVVTIPPDEIAHGSGTGAGEALAAIGAEHSHVDGETPGFHKTETIDVITVVSGELYAVLENETTKLSVGDTFVQRGTAHAWSNRTSEPATFLATMYTAGR